MYEDPAENRDIEMQRNAPQRAEELRALIETDLPAEANLQLELTLVLPREEGQELRVGLRVGEGKWYVVRNIPALLQAWKERKTLEFQSRFVYEPSWMHFSGESERLLSVLDRMYSAQRIGRSQPAAEDLRLSRLPDSVAGELLLLLRALPFRVMDREGNLTACRGIQESPVTMHAECRLTPRGLEIALSLPSPLEALTRSCSCVLSGGVPSFVPAGQRVLLRWLLDHQREGRVLITYPLQAMDQAVGEVLPYLKSRCAVDMSEELRAMLVRKPLRSRVYLDRDGKAIAAQVLFSYGDVEINPFAPADVRVALGKGEKLLLRDGAGEQAVLEILADAGFLVSRDQIRLRREEAQFRFLNEGVKKLGGVSEVFLSREFRKLYVHRPALTGGMRMEGGSLLLSLEINGTPTQEILGIMEALARSRQYFRMKDGTFLNLENLQGWQEGAEAVREAAEHDLSEVDRDALALRGYRAGYLLRLLEECGVPLEVEDSVRQLADEISGKAPRQAAPETDVPLLDYQRRGYEWLFMLDRLHMGGVLADDMGLGKTVQVIALLKATAQEKRTSLIVAPTSLTYNWLSEINRFAPGLSAAIISGNAAQRERMWAHLREHGDLDVAITSYPLLRRDLEWLRDITFRFAVLDEAQNIKNAGSLVASAARQLRADTRLALTGTPMENGVGELWSIFDFVLPGYLPPYHAFLRRYQDGLNSDQLRLRIQPFLTRRLKQDVLADLPDKLETRLTAAMTPEQRNVYLAAMERLRPKVRQAMKEQGAGRGRMEVLSALMELRQICCHPSLVLDGYEGGSGKEDLLMELLPGFTRVGRRMLIFSQFTSMLRRLKARLDREGYETLYLDGATPAGDRLALTERFNGGEGQIFLISLRAGGYGLNLTGADMVIHFDPWWNPAAEEQATDRAYRIGQTKKVDVIRLVMGESIEEKVVELGQRKKALFDQLITPGESGLEALTEQEIRALFD